MCDGDCTLVTDNKGVLIGMDALRAGSAQHLLEGRNGDLWRLVARPLEVEWIKSHLTLEEALDRGFSAADHAGNKAADAAAGAVVASVQLPKQVVDDRARLLEDLLQYQVMISAVQEAQMDSKPARAFRAAARRRRKQAMWGRRAAPAARRERPVVRITEPAAPPPLGVHWLQLEAGPLARGAARCTGPISWAVRCKRCDKRVLGTGRWAAFLRSPCPAAEAPLVLSCTTHQVVRSGRGWACERCALQATPARKAAMARAGCTVPAAHTAAGDVCGEAMRWLAFQSLVLHDWQSWARGRRVGQTRPPEGVAAQAASLTAWRAHWVLSAGSSKLCLRCGAAPTARGPRRLQGTPCGSPARPRAALLVALRAGRFDDALAGAPAHFVARATELGWPGPAR